MQNARTLTKLSWVVRGLRLRRGLTQAELAQAARVSRQWLVSLETGPSRGIEVGRVMKVLDALNASIWIKDDLPEQGDR